MCSMHIVACAGGPHGVFLNIRKKSKFKFHQKRLGLNEDARRLSTFNSFITTHRVPWKLQTQESRLEPVCLDGSS